MSPLVSVEQLSFQHSATGKSRIGLELNEWMLKNLDLCVERDSAVGIVGESGSGKSTLVRILCGLLDAKTGSVKFDGRDISSWLEDSSREFRRRNQLVFQNPASSFDPRMRIGQSLAEPVRAIERRRPPQDELMSWLADVGLDGEVLPRFPHQLSGGQLQRVALARALSVRPRVLYADESTSALDVSVQAQVLNLLMDLRSRHGLTLVMVSHDLAVISRLCEQIIVMRDGEIVERGATGEVLRRPGTLYTANLLAAAKAVSLTSN